MLVLLSVSLGMGSAKSSRGLLQLRADVAISPELEPVSDKKFFKADYPDDRRAPQFHKFGYPYPTVQDTEEYDKDYVEDKNHDGGYWKAQMEYDMLKNKLVKEKQELADAIAKEIKEKNDLEKARKAELDAEHEAEHAEDMAKKAQAKAEAADAAPVDVNAGAEKVEAEITDLEECKKQLAMAKAKLKKLLDEKKMAEKTKVETAKNETTAAALEAAAEKDEEAAEKKVNAEDKEHALSLKTYEEELADVKKVEIDFEKASKDVRKYRRAPHVDDNGGVYETHRGSATRASLLISGLLAVSTAATQLFN